MRTTKSLRDLRREKRRLTGMVIADPTNRKNHEDLHDIEVRIERLMSIRKMESVMA
jgi:hypothetical protein